MTVLLEYITLWQLFPFKTKCTFCQDYFLANNNANYDDLQLFWQPLHKYGISGNLLSWIRNFVADRQQRVVLNNSSSQWVNVTSGVPQGSVLDPLLFILYVNNITDGLKSTVEMFADDSKLQDY